MQGEADLETGLASRNSTERKGEPEIDSIGPVYSNRTGIIARGRDTVLPVNDTSPELRPADAGKPGMVRKLVETSLGAGASLLLGRAGMKKVRRFSPDANPERAPVCARSCTPPPVPLPPLSPRAHALCFPRIARDGGVGGGDGGAGSWPQRVGGER